MHRRLTAAALAATALLALTACSSGSGKPDVAACKTAMEKQYQDAAKTGAQGKRPSACDGVDDKTLQRLAGEVIAEQLGGTPTP